MFCQQGWTNILETNNITDAAAKFTHMNCAKVTSGFHVKFTLSFFFGKGLFFTFIHAGPWVEPSLNNTDGRQESRIKNDHTYPSLGSVLFFIKRINMLILYFTWNSPKG